MTKPPGTILTNPEMEATYFGIPVSYWGEDGEMLALGHPGPRKALAAFNRHARQYCGLVNVADDPKAEAADWLADIREGWLVITTPNPAEGDDPDWDWVSVPATAETPNAVPVTFLDA